MIARRHHWVPQCYLKGFAKDPDKPQLFVIDGKERRTFCTAPANVAAERDFHRIEVEGYAPDALENSFSGFETDLAKALGRIISGRALNDEQDRAYLLNLKALIAIKNPRHRENMRRAQEHTARIIMDLVTSSPERLASQVRRAKADGF